MNTTLSWIKAYVPELSCTDQEYCDAMTMSGTKVESYERLDKWSMYLITSYEKAENDIGRKADKNRKIYNGMLKTYYYQFLGPRPPKKNRS